MIAPTCKPIATGYCGTKAAAIEPWQAETVQSNNGRQREETTGGRKDGRSREHYSTQRFTMGGKHCMICANVC